MKDLIKKIKYNRLPKEVLFLIDILNNVKNNHYNEDGFYIYNKIIRLFGVYNNGIKPQYFTIFLLFYDVFDLVNYLYHETRLAM